MEMCHEHHQYFFLLSVICCWDKYSQTEGCLFVIQNMDMGEQGEHIDPTSSFLAVLAQWLQNTVCSCCLWTQSQCSWVSLLVFLVCGCILYTPIHAQGQQMRLNTGTTVKHVNTSYVSSAWPSSARIPRVFQANLLHISQITMGFTALPGLPQGTGWPRESCFLLGK